MWSRSSTTANTRTTPIDLTTGFTVCEVNRDISPTVFASVMTRLLNQDNQDDEYEVNPLRGETEFRSWVESVGGITEFSLAVTRPNPRYDEWPDELQEKIEETNADNLRIRLRTAEGRHLNADSGVISEYVDFSNTQSKHGTFTARTDSGATFTSKGNIRTHTEDVATSPKSERMLNVLSRLLRRILDNHEE